MEITDRTEHSAKVEVAYSIHLNGICESVYTFAEKLANIGTLVLGGAAAVTAFGTVPWLNIAAALCLAMLAALSLVWSPGRLAEQHKGAKREAFALQAAMPMITVDALYAKLAEIRANAPNGPRWLAAIAFNRSLAQFGHTKGKLPESKFQALISQLA